MPFGRIPEAVTEGANPALPGDLWLRQGECVEKALHQFAQERRAVGRPSKVNGPAGRTSAKAGDDPHKTLIQAINAWRLARDTITFSTQTKRRPRWSDRLSLTNGFAFDRWVDF